MSFRIIQATLHGMFYIEVDGEVKNLDLDTSTEVLFDSIVPVHLLNEFIEQGQYTVVAEG